MDYHPSFDDYFAQKLRLFTELLPQGATAVIDVDTEPGRGIAAVADARGLDLVTVGWSGTTLRLLSAERDGFSQVLTIEHDGNAHQVRLPLVGAFQASNALVAAGLVMATGASGDRVAGASIAARARAGGSISPALAAAARPWFIDYAHTPDALAKALDALRPYAERRLVVVFGCGGDRDKGKRPEMGKVAVAKADRAIVTDDNPRSENPAEIRRQI